jgi:hypothetical protein
MLQKLAALRRPDTRQKGLRHKLVCYICELGFELGLLGGYILETLKILVEINLVRADASIQAPVRVEEVENRVFLNCRRTSLVNVLHIIIPVTFPFLLAGEGPESLILKRLNLLQLLFSKI